MTSPPLRVPMAHQVARATVFLMNLTEPSPKPMLSPPGCRLCAVTTCRTGGW